MQIEGIITKVFPKQEGVSAKTGKDWASQEFVLTTREQYQKSICIRIFGKDRIEQFDVHENELVTVDFDIDANEYNGKWYNRISAWKIVKDAIQPAPKPTGGSTTTGEENERLPF